jgi:hypothetical protein
MSPEWRGCWMLPWFAESDLENDDDGYGKTVIGEMEAK